MGMNYGESQTGMAKKYIGMDGEEELYILCLKYVLGILISFI
jgi:hypothetical protein